MPDKNPHRTFAATSITCFLLPVTHMNKYYEYIELLQILLLFIGLGCRIYDHFHPINWLNPFIIILGILLELTFVAPIYKTWSETKSIKAALKENILNLYIVLWPVIVLCYLGVKALL